MESPKQNTTPNRNRSRSPHFRSSFSPRPGDDGNYEPLWRRRRQVSEKADYENRLSPHRRLSPCARKKSNDKPDWADETEEDNDVYLDRAERALADLGKYEASFKKYEDNKENMKPTSPKPVEIERDADVLIRRQKVIDYGKNTDQYEEYIQNVPKSQRSDKQPWTPDKYQKMTRRNWDKQVKIWRKQLHYWREPRPISELLTPGTSPCPSPHRSPESLRKEKSVLPRSLNFGQDDETACDSFANQLTDIKASNFLPPMNESGDINENSHMSCDSATAELPAMFRK